MTKTRRSGFRKKRRRGGRKTIKRRGGWVGHNLYPSKKKVGSGGMSGMERFIN